MNQILPLYKPLGVTPLQSIVLFKQLYPQYQQTTISYAGRLDPMAEGVLLLLLGEANKERKIYESLAKTYEFSLLVGLETDTYDLLGIPSAPTAKLLSETITSRLPQLLHQFTGTQDQPYPPYSSFHIHNKPLFYYARGKRLDEVSIPTKQITIHSLEVIANSMLSPHELSQTVTTRIAAVSGDFRQAEILAAWNKLLSATSLGAFPLVTMKVTCSSGTYIRSLCHHLGQALGTAGLAFSINRTRVGNYTTEDCLILPSLQENAPSIY